ncbi:MAG: branched-chain amino acid ABC transporter permease [Chloroflexi bacterium]|nr:MAG: branched-chain amino acid ABC transporter permease [Chloroflexota bacterium]
MTGAEFTQTLLNALMLASVYVLMASGFTLIYSIMHIVNFAHGEIYMLGAFAVYYFSMEYHLNFFLALVLAILVVGVLGILLERVLFLPMQQAHLPQVILSLGLAMALQGIASVAFGAGDRPVDGPFDTVLRFGGAAISMERLIIIPISVAIMIALFAFVKWTRTGQAMRAVAQDSDAAALQGIDVAFISCLAFGVGCALASAAGALIAPVFYVNPFMGGSVIMKAFIIICLGGMGSISGAAVGGLILGFVDSFGATLFGNSVANIIGFALLIIILLVRPQGLFGR